MIFSVLESYTDFAMSQEEKDNKFQISGSKLFIYLNKQLDEIKSIQVIESQRIGSGIDLDRAIVIWTKADLGYCRNSGIF